MTVSCSAEPGAVQALVDALVTQWLACGIDWKFSAEDVVWNLRRVLQKQKQGDAPVVAYRIDHGGRSVVFGGDTTLAGDAVTKLATGADLFVANATILDEGAPASLYRLHAPPRRIAEVARDARVGSIVLAHLGGAVIEGEADVLAAMRAVGPADVRLARDCMRIPLPAIASGSMRTR